MTTPAETAAVALQAALTKFATDKIGLTTLVASCVTQLNLVTQDSNALRAAVAAYLNCTIPAVPNLTEAEITDVFANPLGFWATGLALMANIAICLNPATADELLDASHRLLIETVHQFFSDQTTGGAPTLPTPEVIIQRFPLSLDTLNAAIARIQSDGGTATP